MFEIILLQICLIGAPCVAITDNEGPYLTREICEARMDWIMDDTTQDILGYGYLAFCGVVSDPRTIKQHIRKGDTYKGPRVIV